MSSLVNFSSFGFFKLYSITFDIPFIFVDLPFYSVPLAQTDLQQQVHSDPHEE